MQWAQPNTKEKMPRQAPDTKEETLDSGNLHSIQSAEHLAFLRRELTFGFSHENGLWAKLFPTSITIGCGWTKWTKQRSQVQWESFWRPDECSDEFDLNLRNEIYFSSLHRQISFERLQIVLSKRKSARFTVRHDYFYCGTFEASTSSWSLKIPSTSSYDSITR